MRLTDFAYSMLTGQWRVDRARVREFSEAQAATRARRLQLYAGANPGIDRPTPNVLNTPEDFKQAYERIVLIRAARQLEEDFPFVDGILADFETFVVGDMNYVPNTGNPDADKIIREFLEWQFAEVDYSQRLDLTKIAQLAVRTMKRDGECGFEFVDVGDSLKVRYYSADLIGNPLVGANIGPSNYNGILVDEQTHAPVEFHLFTRLPKLNAYVFSHAVPANAFLHLYDPFRFEQYHGVTVFKNGIRHAFDVDQIIEFTKQNIKFRSSQLPVIQNEQGRPRGTGYESQPNAVNGSPVPAQVQVDGVTQTFMKLGEQVVEFPSDFPNQQFLPVTTELKRDMCMGAKLPFEFVYRSETGGVVQRFFADKAQKRFNMDKRDLRRSFLSPTKNRLIQKGIESGMLDLSKFGDLAKSLARFRGTWMMGSTVAVDYGRETRADIELIDAGLMGPDEYASDNGRTMDEVRAAIKTNAKIILEDAKELAKELELPIETVLPYLVKKFPNQKGNAAGGGSESAGGGGAGGAGGVPE